MSGGWRYLVGGAKNGVVFATELEAERAGRELLARWTMYSTFTVERTTEAPTYTFPVDANRPTANG